MTISVAIVGNFVVDYTSESQWARAFREVGCEVTPLQVDDVVRNPVEAMGVLRRHDVATYTRTHSAGRYLDASWTDRWRELEAGGTRTIGLHLDLYHGLEREHLVSEDAQFTVGTLFTADGGHDAEWAALGIDHRWFPPAIDATEAAHEGTPCAEYAHDVIFVGSGRYHVAYPERDDLIRFLHDRFGERFAHYGHGGGRPVVRGNALADLYRSAKLVIGDSCFANAPDWQTKSHRYHSDRVPEVLGRAGAMLYPAVHLDGYRAGYHYFIHEPGDWDSLATAAEIWLDSPAQRERVAVQARDWVRAHHTWKHRMTDVLAELDLDAEARVG